MVTDAAGDALLASSSLPPRAVRKDQVSPMPVLTPAVRLLCYAQIYASWQLLSLKGVDARLAN